MPPSEQPDRIQIAFDDHRLVANAGLLLPVTLAHHLGLGELVDRQVDLGRAPGRAKMTRNVDRGDAWFFAAVMACGFLTFYSLPDEIPFLIRLTMMVTMQFAVGKALQRGSCPASTSDPRSRY